MRISSLNAKLLTTNSFIKDEEYDIEQDGSENS